MGTRTPKRRLSGNPSRRAAQLDEDALRRTPKCQCEHTTGRCGRPAAYRVSALCAADGCESAVDVTLMCLWCKERAIAHHDSTCRTRHRLRVTAL
jgi:hypothetical protein